MSRRKYTFPTEAELCAAFSAVVPEPWVVYPETGGFDLMLVNPETDVHIGVEAKRSGNLRVLSQVLPRQFCRPKDNPDAAGPQFRAVLVDKYTQDFLHVAHRLGLLVFHPPGIDSHLGCSKSWGLDVPPVGKARNHLHERDWFQWRKTSSVELPPIVPEMVPGQPHPRVLSKWRVGSLRLLRRLRTRGHLTQEDFKELGVRPRNWVDSGWVVKHGRGKDSTYTPSTARFGVRPRPDKGYEKEYERLGQAFPEDNLEQM
jgi:hypothetical protein